jgi:hypothetical protein
VSVTITLVALAGPLLPIVIV